MLNTIEANTLTENLLKQSQSQAQELQSRQEDLHASNEDLAKQASRLAEQNIEVEAKNQEVQSAKRLVEEKAEQLAVSSAFKSEFFSNMSHELRTPLNSLLILAGELKENATHNLTEAQVQYASIIQSSGTDLLRLLNDVLDLAKVESGTVTLEIVRAPLGRAPRGTGMGVPARRRTAGSLVRRGAGSRRAADHRHRSRALAAGAQESARPTPSSSPSAGR